MSYKKGQSGNPKGRTPGLTLAGKLKAAVGEEFDELLATIIAAAKGGDMQAMSLLLTRVAAPVKARAMPQAVKLPGDTFKEKLDALTFQLEDGQITVDEFSAMVTALSNSAKLLESDELRFRIEALEAQLQAKP